MIYLDYAANTPVDEGVLLTYIEATRNYIGNPNSKHQAAKAASEYIELATKNILDLLRAEHMDLIYTSGASEANNLAVKGIQRAYRENGKHIISTALEHSSLSAALTHLQQLGYEIDLVSITKEGTVDLEQLKELIRKDTLLISISYVEGELGVVQPISQIAELIKQADTDCFFHVDATQAVGKIPLDLTGIDLLTFAPHKFFGLNGCGALLIREGIVLEPLIHGGKSTSIFRAGTPVPAFAGSMYQALKLNYDRMQETTETVRNMKEYLIRSFETLEHVKINSPKSSLPYYLNLSIPGVKAIEIQKKLDTYGVCVSTKSACSVDNTPSRAVMAISMDRKRALSSIRISFSAMTTFQEIKEFEEIFKRCYKELLDKDKNTVK